MPQTAQQTIACPNSQVNIQITKLEEGCLPFRELLTNGRDIFVLLFIITGTGSCTMNGTSFLLQHNSIYSGYAGCFQEINICEGTQGYFLSIYPQKIEIDYETMDTIGEDLSGINELCIQLEPEIVSDLCWVTSRLFSHIQKENLYNPRLVNKYLTLLLLLIRMQSNAETTFIPMNRKSLLLKNFFFYLEKNYAIHKTVDHYAKLLCVSSKYLTNVIKSESGHPTSYHINQRIILEATKMIKNSGASMKVIAFALGFEDVAAFSKLFKRITGITFKEYKYNLKIEVSRLYDKVVEW